MTSTVADIIPSGPVVATYTLACLLLFATPGPDMSLFLARTLSGGTRAGLAALFGAMAGCCLHTGLAALGLSALVAASAVWFGAVKLAGAFYLLWLAFDVLRRGSALRISRDAMPPASLGRTFSLGLGINLTNPKIVLFFVTFLPQFINPGDPHAAGKLAFLGLYFVVLTTPLGVLAVLAAARIVGFVNARPRLLRVIDYAFAGVFAAFAVRFLAPDGR